jgi:hypothetical protein
MPHALTTTTFVLCLLWCSPAAFPQTQPTAPQTEEPQADQQIDEDIASKVVDPTALLSTLTFQTSFTPSHWGIDDKANEMTFGSVVPFKVWDVQNIGRVRVPYITSSPSGQEVCLTWRSSTSSSSGKNGGICSWEAWLT